MRMMESSVPGCCRPNQDELDEEKRKGGKETTHRTSIGWPHTLDTRREKKRAAL